MLPFPKITRPCINIHLFRHSFKSRAEKRLKNKRKKRFCGVETSRAGEDQSSGDAVSVQIRTYCMWRSGVRLCLGTLRMPMPCPTARGHYLIPLNGAARGIKTSRAKRACRGAKRHPDANASFAARLGQMIAFDFTKRTKQGLLWSARRRVPCFRSASSRSGRYRCCSTRCRPCRRR